MNSSNFGLPPGAQLPPTGQGPAGNPYRSTTSRNKKSHHVALPASSLFATSGPTGTPNVFDAFSQQTPSTQSAIQQLTSPQQTPQQVPLQYFQQPQSQQINYQQTQPMNPEIPPAQRTPQLTPAVPFLPQKNQPVSQNNSPAFQLQQTPQVYASRLQSEQPGNTAVIPSFEEADDADKHYQSQPIPADPIVNPFNSQAQGFDDIGVSAHSLVPEQLSSTDVAFHDDQSHYQPPQVPDQTGGYSSQEFEDINYTNEAPLETKEVKSEKGLNDLDDLVLGNGLPQQPVAGDYSGYSQEYPGYSMQDAQTNSQQQFDYSSQNLDNYGSYAQNYNIAALNQDSSNVAPEMYSYQDEQQVQSYSNQSYSQDYHNVQDVNTSVVSNSYEYVQTQGGESSGIYGNANAPFWQPDNVNQPQLMPEIPNQSYQQAPNQQAGYASSRRSSIVSNLLDSAITCPKCGKRCEAGSNFCMKCGTSLFGLTASSTTSGIISPPPSELSRPAFKLSRHTKISQQYPQTPPLTYNQPQYPKAAPTPPMQYTTPTPPIQYAVPTPPMQYTSAQYGNMQYAMQPATQPVNSTTPEQLDFMMKKRGHVVFCMALNKMVVTAPTRQSRYMQVNVVQTLVEKSYPGAISVMDIKDIVDEGERKKLEFGPLIGKKKKDVLKLVEEKCGGEDDILWRFLKGLVENDGVLPGTGGKNESAVVNSIKEILNMQQCTTSAAHPSALDEVEAALFKGDKVSACDRAVEKELWSHAFIIASNISKEKYDEVLLKYLKRFGVTVDVSEDRVALKAIYGSFGGLGRASVFDQEGDNLKVVEKWREILTMLLTNRCAGDALVISALGDALHQNGRLTESHLCYLLSLTESLFASADTPSARLVLINSDHYANPENFHKKLTAIQMTEVFEYSQTLIPTGSGPSILGASTAGVSAILPHFQQYKLNYAMCLMDYGNLDDAVKYVESIDNIVKSYPKGSPHFTPDFLQKITQLLDRLSSSVADRPKDSSVSGWFTKKNLVNVLDRGLNNLMNNAIGESPVESPKPVNPATSSEMTPPPMTTTFSNPFTAAAAAAASILRPKSTPVVTEQLEVLNPSTVPLPTVSRNQNSTPSPAVIYNQPYADFQGGYTQNEVTYPGQYDNSLSYDQYGQPVDPNKSQLNENYSTTEYNQYEHTYSQDQSQWQYSQNQQVDQTALHNIQQAEVQYHTGEYNQNETYSQQEYNQSKQSSQQQYDQTQTYDQQQYDQAQFYNQQEYSQNQTFNQQEYDPTQAHEQQVYDQTQAYNPQEYAQYQQNQLNMQEQYQNDYTNQAKEQAGQDAYDNQQAHFQSGEYYDQSQYAAYDQDPTQWQYNQSYPQGYTGHAPQDQHSSQTEPGQINNDENLTQVGDLSAQQQLNLQNDQFLYQQGSNQQDSYGYPQETQSNQYSSYQQEQSLAQTTFEQLSQQNQQYNAQGAQLGEQYSNLQEPESYEHSSKAKPAQEFKQEQSSYTQQTQNQLPAQHAMQQQYQTPAQPSKPPGVTQTLSSQHLPPSSQVIYDQNTYKQQGVTSTAPPPVFTDAKPPIIPQQTSNLNVYAPSPQQPPIPQPSNATSPVPPPSDKPGNAVNNHIEEEVEDLGFGNSKKKETPLGDTTQTDTATPVAQNTDSPTTKASTIGSIVGSIIPSFFGRSKTPTDSKTPKVYRANLGEERTLYYDKELGKWVNSKATAEEKAATSLPPPPMGGPATSGVSSSLPPSAITSPVPGIEPPIPGSEPMMRRANPANRRGARSRYVDVLNPDSKASSESSVKSFVPPPIAVGPGVTMFTPKPIPQAENIESNENQEAAPEPPAPVDNPSNEPTKQLSLPATPAPPVQIRQQSQVLTPQLPPVSSQHPPAQQRQPSQLPAQSPRIQPQQPRPTSMPSPMLRQRMPQQPNSPFLHNQQLSQPGGPGQRQSGSVNPIPRPQQPGYGNYSNPYAPNGQRLSVSSSTGGGGQGPPPSDLD